MRRREIVVEAIRNVRSRASRPLSLFACLVVLVGLLAALDGANVVSLMDAYRNFVSSGATIMTASGKGLLDARECESYAGVGPVSSSGAARDHGSIQFDLMPSNPVPLWEVTPGFARILLRSTSTPGPGIVLSDQVAEAIGRTTGDSVGTDLGSQTVSAVYDYPDDGRVPGFGWAALSVVSPSGSFDQCWVDVPSSDETLAMLPLASATSGSAGNVMLGQLNSTLGAHFDIAGSIESRPSRLASVASFLLCFLIAGAFVRSRRVELASALHIGVPKTDLVAQVLLEYLCIALPALFVLASGCVIFSVRLSQDEPLVLLTPLLKIVVSSLCGVVLGVIVLSASVRERLLYRSFRDRG